jgi:hypothetical protein
MPDNDDDEYIKRKKDSAYASGTFSMSNFIQQELLHYDNKKQDHQTRPSSKVTPTTRSLSQKSATRCAEFAGGLVNIDDLKGPEKSFIQREPSVTTGWTSTLGHQLLAASFISSLRNRTEKDQHRTFLKLSESAIADQLTWIEAELFSRIKVTFTYENDQRCEINILYSLESLYEIYGRTTRQNQAAIIQSKHPSPTSTLSLPGL